MYTAPYSTDSHSALEQLHRPPLYHYQVVHLTPSQQVMADESDLIAFHEAHHPLRFSSRFPSQLPTIQMSSSTPPLPTSDADSMATPSCAQWVEEEFQKVFPRDEVALASWTGVPSRRFPYASSSEPLHFPHEVNASLEQSDGRGELDLEFDHNHLNSIQRVEDAKQYFEANLTSGQLSRPFGHPHLWESDSSPHLGSHDELPDLSPTPSHSSIMHLDQCPDEALPAGALPSTREPEEASDVPYAQLIYRALMSVPSRRMILQDIYDWFERNTDKPEKAKLERTVKSRNGWKNSIRHNLSMNGAFRKVERVLPNDGGKHGFIWVLGEDAIRRGFVESTTRYRKIQAPKKAVGPPRLRVHAQGSVARREVKQSTRLDQSDHLSRHASELTLGHTPFEQQLESDDEMEMISHVPESLDRGPIHHPQAFSYLNALPTIRRPLVFANTLARFANSGPSPEQLIYSEFERYTYWRAIDPRLAQHSLAQHPFCDSINHRDGCEFGGVMA